LLNKLVLIQSANAEYPVSLWRVTKLSVIVHPLGNSVTTERTMRIISENSGLHIFYEKMRLLRDNVS